MGENTYKPIQELSFRYVEGSHQLLIISDVQVEILQGETLRLRESSPVIIPAGDFETTLNIDVIRHSNQGGYYTADLEIPILIDDKMYYIGPHSTLPEKIEDIRNQIETKLNVLPPGSQFYSITCDVYEANGDKGGSVTTTMTHGGDIEIN